MSMFGSCHNASTIEKAVALLLNSILLLTNSCLRVRPYFAGLDTLVPRVMKLRFTRSSAVSKPRTTATAATHLTRFLDGTALGTYDTEGLAHD